MNKFKFDYIISPRPCIILLDLNKPDRNKLGRDRAGAVQSRGGGWDGERPYTEAAGAAAGGECGLKYYSEYCVHIV